MSINPDHRTTFHEDLEALHQIGKVQPNQKLSFTFHGKTLKVEIDKAGLGQTFKRVFQGSGREVTLKNVNLIVKQGISHADAALKLGDEEKALKCLQCLSEACEGLNALKKTYHKDRSLVTNLTNLNKKIQSYLEIREQEARSMMLVKLSKDIISDYKINRAPVQPLVVSRVVAEFAKTLNTKNLLTSTTDQVLEFFRKSLKGYSAKLNHEIQTANAKNGSDEQGLSTIEKASLQFTDGICFGRSMKHIAEVWKKGSPKELPLTKGPLDRFLQGMQYSRQAVYLMAKQALKKQPEVDRLLIEKTKEFEESDNLLILKEFEEYSPENESHIKEIQENIVRLKSEMNELNKDKTELSSKVLKYSDGAKTEKETVFTKKLITEYFSSYGFEVKDALVGDLSSILSYIEEISEKTNSEELKTFMLSFSNHAVSFSFHQNKYYLADPNTHTTIELDNLTNLMHGIQHIEAYLKRSTGENHSDRIELLEVTYTATEKFEKMLRGENQTEPKSHLKPTQNDLIHTNIKNKTRERLADSGFLDKYVENQDEPFHIQAAIEIGIAMYAESIDPASILKDPGLAESINLDEAIKYINKEIEKIKLPKQKTEQLLKRFALDFRLLEYLSNYKMDFDSTFELPESNFKKAIDTALDKVTKALSQKEIDALPDSFFLELVNQELAYEKTIDVVKNEFTDHPKVQEKIQRAMHNAQISKEQTEKIIENRLREQFDNIPYHEIEKVPFDLLLKNILQDIYDFVENDKL